MEFREGNGHYPTYTAVASYENERMFGCIALGFVCRVVAAALA